MDAKQRFPLTVIIVALVVLLASTTTLTGCGRTKTEEKGQGEQEQSAQGAQGPQEQGTEGKQVGDALYQEALAVMQGDISYRVSGELNMSFEMPKTPGADGDQEYSSIPAVIPYEALHVKKYGKSASQCTLNMAEMHSSEPLPPALFPEETGDTTYLVDGIYYWEDPSGWQSSPYDPMAALLHMNLRGLMPEDILYWLLYAETVQKAEETEGVVGYHVTLGDDYLKGLQDMAKKTFPEENWQQVQESLEALETIVGSMNIFVAIDKAMKRITEVQFGYGGSFDDVLKDLPEGNPLKGMKFFYSSFLIYMDYGEAFVIEPPL